VYRKTVPRRSGDSAEERNEIYDEDVAPRIKAFLEASEERQAFVARKIKDQLEFFERERQHWGNKSARNYIATRSILI